MGSLLALACAVSWAIAVILFKVCSKEVHPLGLNIYKNSVGLILMVVTWLLTKEPGGDNWFGISDNHIILFLSGFIGIGIADSLYLMALDKIGASRIAIVDSIYLPSVAVISFIWLNESISTMQIFGIAIVVISIGLINFEKDNQSLGKKEIWIGSGLCAFAVLGTASGIIAAKPVLEEVSLIWAIAYRLLAGTVASYMVLLVFRNRRQILGSTFRNQKPILLFIAAFVGTYLSMIFWVGGFKYEKATVAAVLNQTSTILIVFMAAFLLKETVTKKKATAAIMASLGVLLVSLG